MDRFVIKKRRIDDAGSEPSGQSEPGETSESAAGNENCNKNKFYQIFLT